MELALKEVKTQAKKLFKSLQANRNEIESSQAILKKLSLASIEQLQLKHCLTIIAFQLGFENWHHLQKILSGSNSQDEPLYMGTFLYPKTCGGFINEWFSDYQQALSSLENYDGLKWLLPYKKQFIVVKEEYIATFHLADKIMLQWPEIRYNLVESYNSLAWDKLICEIIKNRAKDY